MIEVYAEIIQLILSFITLILGGALIIFIYDAYRTVRQPTLLLFTVGLFVLVLAIVFPDLARFAAPSAAGLFWAAVISRIGEIIGIGVMIYAVLRG
ncbi:MAG: hypothetical protein GKC04_08885 [Methanomicrobiales archaeon]|nr:hypothetical protein [Methanomicrobiales archaeon]